MTKKKILLGLILTILGTVGVATILTMDIHLPPETEAILKGKFTADQIKLLTLINPTILLVLFVVIGTVLYEKVDLKVPFIEKLVGIRKGKLFG